MTIDTATHLSSAEDKILPVLDDFTRCSLAGQKQLLWHKMVADLETPVSATLKLQKEDKPSFLLESVEGGETRGRYSIIGLHPDLIWRCHGTHAEICRDASADSARPRFQPCSKDSVTCLKSLIDESQMELPENLPPMAAGLIGYQGYDMIKLIEEIPSENPDPINIPDACFMRPSVTVIFDARDGVIYITTPIWETHSDAKEAEAAYRAGERRIEETIEHLARPLPYSAHYNPAPNAGEALSFTSNMPKNSFLGMVEKAQEYIRAGDIFQVVPSQRFTTPFTLPAMALYRALRYKNPSPFLFYLNMEGFTLVGSSPEILVRVRNEKVTIRPLAGTRKRGNTRAEDTALEEELLADPKELAEHLMLLDLGRNDVGHCTKPGTVKVTEQMAVERYSHVMHIVSNVEGTLDRQNNTCFDALMCGFPAGTVSGAPKIRAMEIIDELEPHKRSFYAGCVGYFSAGGSMDTCITLRTGLVKDGKLHIQAGGGVVADSTPELEYQESVNKAKALMAAAEFAFHFTTGESEN